MCGSGLRPPPHTPNLSLNINPIVRLGNFQTVLSGDFSVDDDTYRYIHLTDEGVELGFEQAMRKIERRSTRAAQPRTARGPEDMSKAA